MRVAFFVCCLLALQPSCQPKDGAPPVPPSPTPPPTAAPAADAGVDAAASLPPLDAGATMSLVPKRLKQYFACGCGCCPDVNPAERKIQRCVYRDKGETLEPIRDKDEEAKKDPACATAACSQGLMYGYCG